MSFIGGILGVCTAIGLRWRSHQWEKDDFFGIFDSILSIVPFGIILGRIGNFLNQEVYGTIVPANFRWLPEKIVYRAQKLQFIHIYTNIDTQQRINTNLLAARSEWLIMLIICGSMMLYSIQHKKLQPSRISAVFIFWYSFIRFFLEYLRVDSQSEYIGRLTKSQYFFIIFMLIGIYVFARSKSSKIS